MIKVIKFIILLLFLYSCENNSKEYKNNRSLMLNNESRYNCDYFEIMDSSIYCFMESDLIFIENFIKQNDTIFLIERYLGTQRLNYIPISIDANIISSFSGINNLFPAPYIVKKELVVISNRIDEHRIIVNIGIIYKDFSKELTPLLIQEINSGKHLKKCFLKIKINLKTKTLFVIKNTCELKYIW